MTESQKNRNMRVLAKALEGVDLDAKDQGVMEWLSEWEPRTVDRIASWIDRARDAGRAGR